jgi:hypothetical protein
MTLFKSERAKQKERAQQDIKFFDRKIAELVDRRQGARDALNKLNEPTLEIDRAMRDKILRGMFKGTSRDEAFFNDALGAHLLYDTIVIERTAAKSLRVSFSYRGAHNASIEFDVDDILSRVGDILTLDGLHGHTDVKLDSQNA